MELRAAPILLGAAKGNSSCYFWEEEEEKEVVVVKIVEMCGVLQLCSAPLKRSKPSVLALFSILEPMGCSGSKLQPSPGKTQYMVTLCWKQVLVVSSSCSLLWGGSIAALIYL